MQRSLVAFTQQVFDLAIVGGGITGCCIARDAARRGLKVALMERSDFSSGTSAATSKMVHGGLRYLQTLEFGVVRESLRERRAWLHIAPHLVRSLRFLVPAHTRMQDWQVRVGVAAYDALSFDRNRGSAGLQRIDRGYHLTSPELTELEGVLRDPRLRGGMSYGDCHCVAPERVALECLIDAVAHGAVVANYVETTGLVAGDPHTLKLRDALTGDTLALRTRLVINAGGPWADEVADVLGQRSASRITRSKGIHLLTRRVAGPHALTIPVRGRHFFVIPWRGLSLIGTTDTPYTGHPDEVGVDEADIADFLEVINAGLPAAVLTRGDVKWAYAGLRPLISSSATSSYKASRRAEVREEGVGMLSVIGGKWTTSRAVAERCVNLAVRLLETRVKPCETATAPLPGARAGGTVGFEDGRSGDTAVIADLRALLGVRAQHVTELAATAASLTQVLGGTTLAAAVVFAVRDEMAMTLSDVLFRRTVLGSMGPLSHAELGAVAGLMAPEHVWSANETQRQVESVLAQYRRVSMVRDP